MYPRATGYITLRSISHHATIDQREVGVSVPLQDSIGFVPHLIPVSPTVSRPAQRAAIRAYHVPHPPHDCVRVRLFTGGFDSDVFRVASGTASHIPFWLEPNQQLWLCHSYDVYRRFACATHSSQPCPSSPLLLGLSCMAPHGACTQKKGGVVQGASHLAVTAKACPRRLLFVAKQVLCYQVKRQLNNGE